MSTASPLPLEPLPPANTPQALRHDAIARLAQHRKLRGKSTTAQAAFSGMDAAWTQAKPNPIADSVAARFAKRPTYRELLQHEAESATRQAEAAAEVARRNAEAVAAAEQDLLQELQHWGQQETSVDTADLVLIPVPPEMHAAVLPLPLVPELQHTDPSPTVPAGTPGRNIPAMPLFSAEPLEPPVPLPTNLIEFPRQLVATRKARPRLAEGPLRDEADASPERAQLRIFEVEASSFSTAPEPVSSLPEWTSIHLDHRGATHEWAHPDAQISFALPVYAAPLERRLMAAVVDGCCIAAAFLLAVTVAAMAGSALPTGSLAAGVSAITLLVFATGYLLLSFSLSGQTPGMRYARIALCTFGDDNPTRAAMLRRLFATALSGVSLGLGFAWAFLDDDKLGWHDRISRIYQRAY